MYSGDSGPKTIVDLGHDLVALSPRQQRIHIQDNMRSGGWILSKRIQNSLEKDIR